MIEAVFFEHSMIEFIVVANLSKFISDLLFITLTEGGLLKKTLPETADNEVHMKSDTSHGRTQRGPDDQTYTFY